MAEQEATIRELAETVGVLRAENEALRASRAPVASNPAAESPEPSTGLAAVGAPGPAMVGILNPGLWGRSAWPWLLAIAALLGAAALLGWPR